MTGALTFSGHGPYDLPVAQLARAESQGDAVSLTFRVLVNPSQMEVVRIAVLNSQALELAAQILEAASKPA
jgi:hypothetical protein